MATLMDHTSGRCACGHYHPVSQPTNMTNIVEREWIDIWNWVASRRLMSVGADMNWDEWINRGPREPKAQ
jgi:hypothetical protein